MSTSVPGVKGPGCESSHSPSPNAELKNIWSYTSTPTHVSWRGVQLITQKCKFPLYLTSFTGLLLWFMYYVCYCPISEIFDMDLHDVSGKDCIPVFMCFVVIMLKDLLGFILTATTGIELLEPLECQVITLTTRLLMRPRNDRCYN
jgi:hypothetical protein